jgi:phage tail-like protein
MLPDIVPAREMESDASSRLLNYLPGIYADDPFIDELLRIVESLWSPLDRQIDQLHAYFDPRLTPAEFLPWLATWVDLVLDENLSIARRRALIRHAADLYRRRGTACALRDFLTICTGIIPEIAESDRADQPFHFTVTLRVPSSETVDRDRVVRIIDEEKPAHTTYTLRLEKA